MAEEVAVKVTPGPTTYGGIRKSPSSSTLKGSSGTAGGPMNVIKVAMHMLRRKKSLGRKKPAPASATNDTLTRLVGSVRPLHHLPHDASGMVSPPLFLPSAESPGAQSESSFFTGRSPSASSSSGGTISRYASFQSLYELEILDEDEFASEEADAYYDGMEGDELIDSKAETFIAQYYRSQLKPIAMPQ